MGRFVVRLGHSVKRGFNSMWKTTERFLSVSSAYALLFAFSGMVIGAYVTIDIYQKIAADQKIVGVATGLIISYTAIIILSFVHQFKIYSGFHEIESDEAEWKTKTGGWAGYPFEKVIRIVILFVILGAFSKGGPIIDIIALFSKIPCSSVVCMGVPEWVPWLQSINNSAYKTKIFLVLISTTFALYIIWEIICLAFISKFTTNADDKKKYMNNIFDWMKSDFSAFIIWSCTSAILIADAPISWFLFPVILLLFYANLIDRRFIGLRAKVATRFENWTAAGEASSGS